ncbi:MAG: glycosyltransferase family 39 protein [Chloroflexi bacterium]|nr:glycosyltransferase family 39 protein [Chloroflexota bacterium]
MFIDGKRISSAWLIVPLMVLAYLLISNTPYHYWDEWFYLYSMLHRSPREMMDLELDLAKYNLFPGGFYSSRVGFLFFLQALIRIFGSGLPALFTIQFVLTVVMVGTVALSYLLLREIFDTRDAGLTALVLLFLPVTVYLGYKALSEGPSLFFITLSGWLFVRGFRTTRRPAVVLYIVLAIVSMAAGILTRFAVFFFPVGLILGLLILRDPKRYPLASILWRAGVVAVGVTVIVAAAFVWIGPPYDRFMGLAYMVRSLQRGIGVKIYALAMTAQLFLPALLLGMIPPWSRKTTMALVWATFCIFPLVVWARHVEPRHFYTALIPLAILVQIGLTRLSTWLARTLPGLRFRAEAIWALLLALFTLGDGVIFAPLSPYEVNQQQYIETMSRLSARNPDASHIVPWIADYGFLSFAYPEKPVYLAFSEPSSGNRALFQSKAFLAWVRPGSYLGTREELNNVPGTPFYIGWTYNPIMLNLKDMLGWSGINYFSNLEQLEGRGNHLAMSWIWLDPALKLEPVGQIGQYHVFAILPR